MPLSKLSPPQNAHFKGNIVFNGSVTIYTTMKQGFMMAFSYSNVYGASKILFG